jgi:hypothetical protein
MSDERSSRIECKLDVLLDRTARTETKLENIADKVESIEAKTIAHDNYTSDIAKRVTSIESFAKVPAKIFEFSWKASLFVGVITSLIYWIKG